MESVGVFADGEWESLSRLFTSEEVEFTPHFLSEGNSFPFQHNEGMGFETRESFYPNIPGAETLFHHPSSDSPNSNVDYLSSRESCNYGDHNHGIFTTILNQENCYFSNSCNFPVSNIDVSESMDFYMNRDGKSFASFVPASSDIMMHGSDCNKEDSGSDSQPAIVPVPEKELQLKRVHDAPEKSSNDTSDSNPKKKPRLSKDVEKSRKNNVRSKKGQKGNSDVKFKDEEERLQSTSSCTSEGDNGSLEINGGETSDPKASSTHNLNGKTRANRGSATDPQSLYARVSNTQYLQKFQSLYARKRRERINERLRTLQHLVPNGTKVDISTMLEEAVHYVKFLQLQIKLLSSDDMWMYAPIAYNGMDIALDLQKLSPLL